MENVRRKTIPDFVSVKKKFEYDTWPKLKSSTPIPITNVDEVVNKYLVDMKMEKVWQKERFQIKKINGTIYFTLRKKWKNIENNILDLTIVVCPSFEAAKKFLLFQYASFVVPPKYLQPWKSSVGDLCFAFKLNKKNSTVYTDLHFIRQNILIMLEARGENLRKKLNNTALDLDRKLSKFICDKKNHLFVSNNASNPFQFSLTKRSINMGESTNIIIRDEELNDNPQFYWEVNGGEVEKVGNDYFYLGTQTGLHTVKGIVINNSGVFQISSPVSIEVLMEK